MPNRRPSNGSLSAKEALVLATLRKEQRPHTAYELIEQLHEQGIKAPPTIYRALKRLIALGHAHRLESLNAYVACRHGHCTSQGKAGFVICDDCGHVEEIEELAFATGIQAWAQKSRFAVASITLELHGTCQTCRNDRVGNEQKG